MAKPTILPRWATDGGADVTEPSSGQKDSGYVDAQAPDAGELNWLLLNNYLWEVWLDAFESTAHTWTATQTFDAAAFNSLTIGALSIVSSGALTIDDAGLIELGTAGDIGCVDLSVNNSFNVNGAATLTGATFSGDVAFNGSSGITIQKRGVAYNGLAGYANMGGIGVPGLSGYGDGTLYALYSVADTAAGSLGAGLTIQATSPTTARALQIYKQGAGAYTPDLSYTSVIAEIAGALQFTGANPLKTDASLNSVTALNTCKAHAKITQNNTVSPAFDDGFNIVSVVEVLPLGAFTVTFAQPMANANYTVSVTCDNDFGTAFMAPAILFRTVNSFAIQAHKVVANTNASSTETSGNVWNVTVFGRQ